MLFMVIMTVVLMKFVFVYDTPKVACYSREADIMRSFVLSAFTSIVMYAIYYLVF